MPAVIMFMFMFMFMCQRSFVQRADDHTPAHTLSRRRRRERRWVRVPTSLATVHAVRPVCAIGGDVSIATVVLIERGSIYGKWREGASRLFERASNTLAAAATVLTSRVRSPNGYADVVIRVLAGLRAYTWRGGKCRRQCGRRRRRRTRTHHLIPRTREEVAATVQC